MGRSDAAWTFPDSSTDRSLATRGSLCGQFVDAVLPANRSAEHVVRERTVTTGRLGSTSASACQARATARLLRILLNHYLCRKPDNGWMVCTPCVERGTRRGCISNTVWRVSWQPADVRQRTDMALRSA